MNRGQEIEVPDVVGLSWEEAQAVLADHDLNPEKGGEKESNLPKDFVVEQNPEAGMKVRPKRRVVVILSTGSGKIHIPNLVGRTIRQAEMVLNRLGLSIGEINEVHSEDIEEGGIIAQTPPAHEIVERGDTIDLLVSLGPEEAWIIMPSVVGLDLKSAQNELNEWGLKVGEVIEVQSEDVIPGRVVRQDPEMGEQVKKGDKIDLFLSAKK
jgi:serine/threonine-protein kinase